LIPIGYDNMFAKYKKGIISILIIVLLFVVYSIFIKPDPEQEALLKSTASAKTGSEIVGADIIKALNQIESLKLDQSIFADIVYLSLIDRSQEIPLEEVGRSNPFAPLGTDAVSITEEVVSDTLQ
jgi:hypothetical protein